MERAHRILDRDVREPYNAYRQPRDRSLEVEVPPLYHNDIARVGEEGGMRYARQRPYEQDTNEQSKVYLSVRVVAIAIHADAITIHADQILIHLAEEVCPVRACEWRLEVVMMYSIR